MRLFAGDPQWVSAHVTQQNRDIARQDVRQGTEIVGLLAGDQVGAMFSFAGGVHGYFASRANDYLLGDRAERPDAERQYGAAAALDGTGMPLRTN